MLLLWAAFSFCTIGFIFMFYKAVCCRKLWKLFDWLSYKEKAVIIISESMGILGGVAFLLCVCKASDSIVINEVCSNNFSVIFDEKGEYSDYIELYNPSDFPAVLANYSLSDEETAPKAGNFGGGMIPAKGYLLIFADGTEDRAGHADFKISDAGETVYLRNNTGKLLDSVQVPSLKYNTGFSRISDGSAEWAVKEATPGGGNDEAERVKEKKLKEPEISHESGFYEKPFYAELKAEEGEKIYYTLDGSEPADTESETCFLYQKPVLIKDASKNENVYSARTDLSTLSDYVPKEKVDKAVVFRAAAYHEQTGDRSETITRTYFVGFDEKTEYDGLAVISMITDPANLFDPEKGIYANGNALEEYKAAGGYRDGELLSSFEDENGQTHYMYMASNAFESGKESEREAVIEYFDEAHGHKFRQKAGIRISGESTRNVIQKSFNVYARDIYDGNTIFPYEIFEGRLCESFKLRNGGSDNEKNRIVDDITQELAENRKVSIQRSRPCVLFLNGEYWGIYSLRERYKEDYFAHYYGINENDILMMDAGRVSIGGEEAWEEYEALLTFAGEHDLSVDENYRQIQEMMDIESFIDFYCINLYINNTDMAFDKNIGIWRSRNKGTGEYEDGRWRFMLYDQDVALRDYDRNTFEEPIWWQEGTPDIMDHVLMKSLMHNEEFRNRFYDAFLEIADTVYFYDYVHGELEEWKGIYKEQVLKSYRRFFGEIEESEYEAEMSAIDIFFKLRREYMVPYLEQELLKPLEGNE